MPKFYKLTVCLLLLYFHVSAQYADVGSGALRNRVWWFNWTNSLITNGTVKNFMTTDGLIITCSFSSLYGTAPQPGIMNAESGSLLHTLYDFTNIAVKPALVAADTKNNTYFNVHIEATRNGTPVPFTLVAADAAVSDATETYTLTSSTSHWKLLEFYHTCTVKGCGTPAITISNTAGGSVLAALYTTTAIDLTVQMERTTLGTSALAFGLFEPVDRGDLPASFGYADHQIAYTLNNDCTQPSLTPVNNLYLGKIPGDPDPAEQTDDGADEDALTVFPDYTGNGSYSLDVPLVNTTGHDAYLSAWFDNNRNGYFEGTEGVLVTVHNGATTAHVTWSNLPAAFISGKMAPYAFRFRIAEDKAAVSVPGGYAGSGEVEDYLEFIKAPCVARLSTLADVTICHGKRAQLSATGITTCKWTPAAGLTADTMITPVASPDTTTTYRVQGMDAFGCPGKGEMTVYVNPTPVVTASKDTFLCTGTSIPLEIHSDLKQVTYSWLPVTGLSDPLSSNPVASPMTPMQYLATATTVYGCSSTDTISLQVYPSPVFAVTPDSPFVCIGQSVVMAAKGGDDFAWMTGPADSLLSHNATIEVAPVKDSLFKVYMTHHLCRVSDTVYVPVVVHAIPVTSIEKSSDIDCAHPKAQLLATGGIYYNWEPAPGLADQAIANPVVDPLATTTYQVTIKDQWGCSNVESVTVGVDIALTFTRYPLPSAFTPNGDGVNDCFGLKYWGSTDAFDFNVYNRDGRLVFSSHSPEVCWDGTFKGQPLPVGNYIYMIRARTVCGDVIRKGTVLLLR